VLLTLLILARVPDAAAVPERPEGAREEGAVIERGPDGAAAAGTAAGQHELEQALASARLRAAALEAELGRLKRASAACPQVEATRPGAVAQEAPRALPGPVPGAGARATPSWVVAALAGGIGLLLGVLGGHGLRGWRRRRRYGSL
jgi:hypothetical protein